MADHPDSGTRGRRPARPVEHRPVAQPGDPRDPASRCRHRRHDVGPSSPPADHTLAAATAGGHAPVVHRGYEHSDVNIKPLVVTALILIVGGAIVHLVLWALFAVFEKDEKSQPENQRRSLVTRAGRFPTGTAEQTPPLQGIPGFHMNAPALDMDEQQARTTPSLTTTAGRTSPACPHPDQARDGTQPERGPVRRRRRDAAPRHRRRPPVPKGGRDDSSSLTVAVGIIALSVQPAIAQVEPRLVPPPTRSSTRSASTRSSTRRFRWTWSSATRRATRSSLRDYFGAGEAGHPRARLLRVPDALHDDAQRADPLVQAAGQERRQGLRRR